MLHEIRERDNMGQMLGRIEEYWTNRAEGYSQVNQEELATEQKNRWLKALEMEFPHRDPKDIRVLDIGTGPGFFAIILAKAGYQVTAVDYTEEMLCKAKKNAGRYADRICWMRMDAQKLELPDNQFDVAVSRNLTWNLENPDEAYKEWKRVLKPGGQLLNFDANWYGHLFDAEKRREYEEDRKHVEEQAMEDHYIGTDIDEMEEIARNVPLSPVIRPAWDMKVLKNLGFQSVRTDEQVWQRVWSDTEKVNYASTPMFMIKAVK